MKCPPKRTELITCCPSVLCIVISPSFRHIKDQLPTTNRVEPACDSIGCVCVEGLIILRTFCNFSKNSPRFSTIKEKNCKIYANLHFPRQLFELSITSTISSAFRTATRVHSG